jgi:hypothetical protein
MMHVVKIKPVSVNDAYTGRRFATRELKGFKELLMWMLPKIDMPEGRLEVWYEFGVSKNSDGDNCQKAFQDALSAQYGFNDRMIYAWHGRKVDVPKGKEYVGFEIRAMV